jgi:hypothetical protein
VLTQLRSWWDSLLKRIRPSRPYLSVKARVPKLLKCSIRLLSKVHGASCQIVTCQLHFFQNLSQLWTTFSRNPLKSPSDCSCRQSLTMSSLFRFYNVLLNLHRSPLVASKPIWWVATSNNPRHSHCAQVTVNLERLSSVWVGSTQFSMSVRSSRHLAGTLLTPSIPQTTKFVRTQLQTTWVV